MFVFLSSSLAGAVNYMTAIKYDNIAIANLPLFWFSSNNKS